MLGSEHKQQLKKEKLKRQQRRDLHLRGGLHLRGLQQGELVGEEEEGEEGEGAISGAR